MTSRNRYDQESGSLPMTQLAISSLLDANILQDDLSKLEQWEKSWDMNFNPAKCQVLHVTRSKTPIPSKYFLHNTELESAAAAKYLGSQYRMTSAGVPMLTISPKKANQTLGFLTWNIKVHKLDLKSTAYKTLVSPQLEYASTVWSLHTATDIQKIESVQCRAARWATRDYRYTSSVTSMLNNLNWCPLDQRRIDCRLSCCTKSLTTLLQSQPPNRKQSRHIHSLAYRQIPTLKNYYINTPAFLERSYIGMPSQLSYLYFLPWHS